METSRDGLAFGRRWPNLWGLQCDDTMFGPVIHSKPRQTCRMLEGGRGWARISNMSSEGRYFSNLDLNVLGTVNTIGGRVLDHAVQCSNSICSAQHWKAPAMRPVSLTTFDTGMSSGNCRVAQIEILKRSPSCRALGSRQLVLRRSTTIHVNGKCIMTALECNP